MGSGPEPGRLAELLTARHERLERDRTLLRDIEGRLAGALSNG